MIDETLRYNLIDIIDEYYASNINENNLEDSIEEYKELLFYLYNTSIDKKLKAIIEDWFKEKNYCIKCGEKLRSYEYREKHDEIEGDFYEYFNVYLCPDCDYAYVY